MLATILRGQSARGGRERNVQRDDTPDNEEGEGEKVGYSKGEAEEYAEDTAPVGRMLAVFDSTINLRAQNISLLCGPSQVCVRVTIDTRRAHQLCKVVDSRYGTP